MTKYQYDFIKAEIEREKNASPFYLACRELPDNYEELKREYYNECIRGVWTFEKVNNMSCMPNINTNAPKSWGFSQLYFTKNREELSQLPCKHENIKSSDECDECMDCDARNY